jgi:DNA-binding transcriptional ArsR family regulator
LADPHRFTLFAARDLEPRVVVVGKVLGVLELREAGFVEATVDAQRRLYRLKPEALLEIEAWLAPFRRLWSAHVDALERHLDRMDRKPAAKRKTRKKK